MPLVKLALSFMKPNFLLTPSLLPFFDFFLLCYFFIFPSPPPYFNCFASTNTTTIFIAVPPPSPLRSSHFYCFPPLKSFCFLFSSSFSSRFSIILFFPPPPPSPPQEYQPFSSITTGGILNRAKRNWLTWIGKNILTILGALHPNRSMHLFTIIQFLIKDFLHSSSISICMLHFESYQPPVHLLYPDISFQPSSRPIFR